MHYRVHLLYVIEMFLISIRTYTEANAVANFDSVYDSVCKPNSYLDFGCNTCFCGKTGKIEQKWCTRDDCSLLSGPAHAGLPADSVCTPGTVHMKDCNFCLCPMDGSSTSLCTRSSCEQPAPVDSSKLTCTPFSYYRVDCNVCRCPSDGRRNVFQCSKRTCEASSGEGCEPGAMFAEGCGVCVCPPSGEPSGRVCSDAVCDDRAADRRSLLEFPGAEGTTGSEPGSIEVCFPGEEFRRGCSVCVCTEVGLRAYADCSLAFCEDGQTRRAGWFKLGRDENGDDNKVC